MSNITLNSKNDPRAMDAGSAVARRVGVGIVVSVVLNIVAFAVGSRLIEPGSARSTLHPDPVEVALRPERPVATPTPLAPTPKSTPTPIAKSKPTPTPIAKSKPTPTPIAKPKPTPTPIPTPTPKATPLPTPQPRATPVPQARPTPTPVTRPAPRQATVRPEGAHNKVVTQRSTTAAPSPQDFTVRSGGNARAGQVMAQQSAGNAQSAPDVPTAPVKPISTPDPTPTPAPVARVAEAPRPAPQPTAAPEAPRPPRVSGPTRDSEFTLSEKPQLPDNLKRGTFKSFVRFKVEVHPDGSFDPILRVSSGNSDIDAWALDTIKHMGKVKPKLVNGVPQESTELVKFEFDVS